MPLEKLGRRAGNFLTGEHGEQLAIQGVVVATIVELLPDSPTDLDPVIQRYGEVAKVEKIMEVGAQ